MNRPVLLAILGAALIAVLILAWPPMERDTVVDGLLPGGQRPRLANVAAPTLEASAAARMIAFAPPGAGPAPTDPTVAPSAAAAPPPPAIDRTPLLVGVAGSAAAPVGYFSYQGQTYRARRGETIGGWKVTALTRVQASLAKGRRRLTTALFAGRTGPLSPQMSAATAAPAQMSSQPGPQASAAPAAPTASSPAAPPPGVRKPKALPPLPPGSKGWWAGPKGEAPPPGYTRIPG